MRGMRCLVLCVAGASGCAMAAGMQMEPYITLGYALPIGGTYAASADQATVSGGVRALNESKDYYVNYGRGLKIDAGVFLGLAKSVDAQLGLRLTAGVPATVVESNEVYAGLNSTRTDTREFHHSMLGLQALIVPTTRAFGLLDAHIGIGMSLNLVFNYFDRVRITRLPTSELPPDEEHTTTETRPAIGFLATGGLEFPIGKNLVLVGDLCFEAMNVTIKKKEFEAGGDFGSTTVNYEKDATDREPPPKIPASNIGLRVGVKLPL